MHTGRRVSIITIGFGLLATGLEAQTPGDHLLYQDTLQQRMQRSVSRQVESASRMRAALDLQRQTVQRQTGDVAAVVVPFFTLPAPARMAPRPASNIEPQAVESNNDDSVEHNNADTEPEPPYASDAPPAHLMPMIPIANITVPGIPGIPAIAGIDSGGIIAAKSVRAALGERKEGEVDRLATAGATALRNAGGPYIQQLLQAMGGDGATALPSPLGPQQNAAGNYSGRDSAPLTSFSLVDWLFGL